VTIFHLHHPDSVSVSVNHCIAMAQKPGQIYSDAPDKTNLTVGHTKTLELNEI